MVSQRQIRAARALLGWSQQDLADRAILSLNAVKRLENGKSDPRLSTITAVQSALEAGGIEFIPAHSDKGEGVRLKQA
jgi:transcriptional regulator with XRE-family HTH domain